MRRHLQHVHLPGPRQGLESFGEQVWRLSGDVPIRPTVTLLWTVTLLNEPWIEIPEAVEPYTHARLRHDVKRLVQEPTGDTPRDVVGEGT
jgi:hypothetical protein